MPEEDAVQERIRALEAELQELKALVQDDVTATDRNVSRRRFLRLLGGGVVSFGVLSTISAAAAPDYTISMDGDSGEIEASGFVVDGGDITTKSGTTIWDAGNQWVPAARVENLDAHMSNNNAHHARPQAGDNIQEDGSGNFNVVDASDGGTIEADTVDGQHADDITGGMAPEPHKISVSTSYGESEDEVSFSVGADEQILPIGGHTKADTRGSRSWIMLHFANGNKSKLLNVRDGSSKKQVLWDIQDTVVKIVAHAGSAGGTAESGFYVVPR